MSIGHPAPKEGLARCPFCGADETIQLDPRFHSPAVTEARYDAAGCSTVECMKCGARGPLEKDHAEAIRKWNEAGWVQLYWRLQDMAAQYHCGCGHPACRRCRDDKENRELLAKPPIP